MVPLMSLSNAVRRDKGKFGQFESVPYDQSLRWATFSSKVLAIGPPQAKHSAVDPDLKQSCTRLCGRHCALCIVQ